jgi:SNF2 family DNA or RNA helicase
VKRWQRWRQPQAVARCHRMVRRVQVHRLVAKDSVDERMLEIFQGKAELFDEYVRRSDLKDATPQAVDISEIELARRIVAAEQDRLGVDSTEAVS